MIKKILKIQLLGALLLSVNVAASTKSNCNGLTGCKKKICSIEKNIAIAKEKGNKSRVKGLEISLKKVNKHCTDDNLREDLEVKINDTKKDLKEDKKDHKRAVKDNRPSKIEKYEDKMAKENKKIKILQKELKELK